MTRHALWRCAVAAATLALAAPAGAETAARVQSKHAKPDVSNRSGLTPNARERRAVRGRAVLDAVEAPDQAQVRRFEESLPEPQAPAEPTSPTAPTELAGTWTGSGDESGHSAGLAGGGALTALYRDFFNADAAGREAASTMLARLGPWLPRATEALGRTGVPAETLGAALALSGFDVDARSRDGRAGPWLLGAAQARAQGLRVDQWIDDRRDPVRASEAAGQILSGLHARLGSWPLALAAYHAGPELVEASRAALEPLATDLVHLLAAGSPLPRATRLFLARATALGDHLGAAPLPAAEATPHPMQVPGTLTLDTIAKVTGVDRAALRQLNPALLLDRVAPFAPSVPLWVPAGTKAISLAAFEAGKGPIDQVTIVPLRLGESAQTLAEQRGLAPRDLARLNGVREAGELRGPTELLLPTAEGSGLGAVADAANDPPLVAVPARPIDVPGSLRRFYFVNDGDGLDEIAAAAEVSVAELLAWNNLDRDARLQAKMVLQVFVRPELDMTRLALVDPARVRAVAVGSDEFHALEVAKRGKTRVVHAVRSGDTIAKIARRYGLGVPDLARINRMSWNTELSNGQNVVVYAPSAGAGAQKLAAGRSVLSKRGAVSGGATTLRTTSKPAKPVARPAHTRPVRPATGR